MGGSRPRPARVVGVQVWYTLLCACGTVGRALPQALWTCPRCQRAWRVAWPPLQPVAAREG